MPRIARITYPEAIYHVMHRGNNRQKIFHQDDDYRYFLKLLKELTREFGVRLYVFALMSTHFHLLLEAVRNNLSLFMKALDMRYMFWYRKNHKLIGHLFQGRFKSIIVDKDAYLLHSLRLLANHTDS